MSNMEWIETTGKTVAEAREHALDQLRVDESEIEFEVIEEPRSGLFGRTRGVARVRARVAHKAPRPKTERRKRTKKSSGNGNGRKNGDGGTDSSDKASKSSPPASNKSQPKREAASKNKAADQNKKSGEDMTSSDVKDGADQREPNGGSRPRANREPMDESRQIEVLEEFLSGVLGAFGLTGEMESTLDGKDLTVNIKGENLGLLVGPRLATLESLQELARLSLQREAEGKEYARVTVDVEGIRNTRRDSLEAFVKSAADRARDEGSTVVFEEMSSADRKQVHDLASTIDGVKSVSEGEDPRRRVALVPDA